MKKQYLVQSNHHPLYVVLTNSELSVYNNSNRAARASAMHANFGGQRVSLIVSPLFV